MLIDDYEDGRLLLSESCEMEADIQPNVRQDLVDDYYIDTQIYGW